MLLGLVLLAPVSCQNGGQSATKPSPENGTAEPGGFSISCGDVTARSAIIWARATAAGDMHVSYDSDARFLRPKIGERVGATDEKSDFTSKIKLENLQPSTLYYYRVWFTSPGDRRKSEATAFVSGRFKTAPGENEDAAVSFLLGGDTGGQGYCRRPGIGYSIYSSMRTTNADFYIQNGDGIYADYRCPEKGPEPGWQNVPGNFVGYSEPNFDWTNRPAVRETIFSHYRYNRSDEHVEKFLSSLSTYAQWDDHEVINDFGAQWTFWNPSDKRPGYPVLVDEGLSAFQSYWPIEPNPSDPRRLYRSFRWGKNLELFLLDMRSYRSRNDLADTVDNHKTLLGKAQLEWLEEGLAKST